MKDDKLRSCAAVWVRECREALAREEEVLKDLERGDWDLFKLLAPRFERVPDDAGAAAQGVLRLVDAYGTAHRALSHTPHEEALPSLRKALLNSLKQLEDDEERRRTYAAVIGGFGAPLLLIGTIMWASGALLSNRVVLWWGAAIAVLGVMVTSPAVLVATRGRQYGLPGRLWGLAPAVTLVVVVTVVLFSVTRTGPPAATLLSSAGVLALVAVAAGIVIYGLASASRDSKLPLQSFSQLLLSDVTQTPPHVLLAPETMPADVPMSNERAQRDASRLIDWMSIETDLRANEEGRRCRRWQWAHYVLGAGAAAAAGVAGVTFSKGETSGAFEYVVLFGAFLAATLSGVVTAVNPGRIWEEARTAQRTLDALKREITIMQQIYLRDEPQKRREALDYVLQRFEQTAGTPQHETFWRRRE